MAKKTLQRTADSFLDMFTKSYNNSYNKRIKDEEDLLDYQRRQKDKQEDRDWQKSNFLFEEDYRNKRNLANEKRKLDNENSIKLADDNIISSLLGKQFTNFNPFGMPVNNIPTTKKIQDEQYIGLTKEGQSEFNTMQKNDRDKQKWEEDHTNQYDYENLKGTKYKYTVNPVTKERIKTEVIGHYDDSPKERKPGGEPTIKFPELMKQMLKFDNYVIARKNFDAGGWTKYGDKSLKRGRIETKRIADPNADKNQAYMTEEQLMDDEFMNQEQEKVINETYSYIRGAGTDKVNALIDNIENMNGGKMFLSGDKYDALNDDILSMYHKNELSGEEVRVLTNYMKLQFGKPLKERGQ